MITCKRSFLKLSRLAAAIAMGCAGVAAQAADITGAGATFPYAVYSKWAEAYKAASGNTVNYQGIGSSGGIKQIKAKTVDFGATDAPLAESDLASAGLVQVPAVMGGVTIVANVPGIASGQLKLDGATAADIFRGAIRKWNDPAIARLNSGAKLPDTAITIVHRSDGSGTTDVMTNYLARQSAAFKSEVGVGKSVNWPANGIGGKGNAGVAANVQKIVGTIGYVDFADARKNGLKFIALGNKSGNFVVPSGDSFKAAAAGANFSVKGMAPDLIDQTNKDAWPIVTATYILAYEKGDNPDSQQGVVDFFTWALNNGQSLADGLDFVALPSSVVKAVEVEMRRIK